MKYILSILLLTLVSFSSVSAYELILTEVSEPYEIVPVNEVSAVQQVHLGELNNFPVMYEVVANEPFVLTAKLSQLYRGGVDPLKLSLMIIRLDDRGGGVTEVARFSPTADAWQVRKDSMFGMTFWDSETVSKEVEPGTYRIEVSTPENIGRYSLTLGSEVGESKGYFATLSQIKTTQKFFGYSFVRLLASSYVYYFMGIMLILLAFYRTWRFKQSIDYVS